MIVFTKHAENKFVVLRQHKCYIGRDQVLHTLEFPDRIEYGRSPFLIAQKSIDNHRVLRVVYRERRNVKIVITFYPGKKSQYEK